ncbi:MAG: hypothetical protein JO154_17115 [Chitinophaga sp.]|uniref:DUF6580 family putative transport protein n=1 Tax=Chitinophaga sp. TaxID=1869181 RepID=UPI0025C103E4|nr:DUF6580 family putative transport protein [Chitinophaga sp.]MBV8254323.1 hypothetical protein [Chitinophaga sp.]
MSLKNLNPQFGILLLFIIVAGVIRVVLGADASMTPIAMYTPIGAMALFGGATFQQKWKSYVFPLLTLFVSDVVLMQVFHKEYASGLLYSGWYWTYLSFILVVVIGQVMIKKIAVGNIVLASVVAAIVHWIISDFGVWIAGSTDLLTGKPYTKDMAGFISCYAQAIPYMRYFLMGTLIYSGVFFGGLVAVQYKKLRAAH